MELTIQHLSPYLPYGLKLSVPSIWEGFTCTLVVYNNTNTLMNGMDINTAINYEAKPILKKLNLYSLILNKFAENTDAEFMGWFNDDIVNLDLIEDLSVESLPFGGVQWLIKNHYDVFGLIEAKLAVEPDYNW